MSALPRNDWLLWQLADSAFPAGGFAHSSGLEAAWQHGEVRNRADLASFMEAGLGQFGHGSMPFMTAAHRNPDHLEALDKQCDQFITNHVANRASRLQGRAWLSSAQRIFGRSGLTRLGDTHRAHPPCGHLAPWFGVVLRALDVGREPAARLFIFLQLRGMTASAVRLGIVGPLEAQALQHDFEARVEQVLARCQHLAIEDLAQTTPLIDLWQGAHDRLYTRLFQS